MTFLRRGGRSSGSGGASDTGGGCGLSGGGSSSSSGGSSSCGGGGSGSSSTATFTSVLSLNSADSAASSARSSSAVSSAHSTEGGRATSLTTRLESLGASEHTTTQSAALGTLSAESLTHTLGANLADTLTVVFAGTPSPLALSSQTVLSSASATTGTAGTSATLACKGSASHTCHLVEDTTCDSSASTSAVTLSGLSSADLSALSLDGHASTRGSATLSVVTEGSATWLDDLAALARADGARYACTSGSARTHTSSSASTSASTHVSSLTDTSADISGGARSSGGSTSGGLDSGLGRSSGGHLARLVHDLGAVLDATSSAETSADLGTVSLAHLDKLGAEGRSGCCCWSCCGGLLLASTLVLHASNGLLGVHSVSAATTLQAVLSRLALSSPSLPHSPSVAELAVLSDVQVLSQMDTLVIPLEEQLPSVAGTTTHLDTLAQLGQAFDVSLTTGSVLTTSHLTGESVETTSAATELDELLGGCLVTLLQQTTEVTNQFTTVVDTSRDTCAAGSVSATGTAATKPLAESSDVNSVTTDSLASILAGGDLARPGSVKGPAITGAVDVSLL